MDLVLFLHILKINPSKAGNLGIFARFARRWLPILPETRVPKCCLNHPPGGTPKQSKLPTRFHLNRPHTKLSKSPTWWPPIGPRQSCPNCPPGGAPIGLRLCCPNYLPGDPHPNWPQPKLPKLPTRWHPNSPKTNFQKLRQNFMGLGRRFICHFTVFVSFAFEGRVSKGTNRNLTLCRTWGQIEILQYDEQRTWGQIEILQCNGWRLS